MSNKVKLYLNRIFGTTSRASCTIQQTLCYLITALLPLYLTQFVGSEAAITASHAIIWVFIIYNFIGLLIVSCGEISRRLIKLTHPILSDELLFTPQYKGNLATKFMSLTDTPILGVVAIMQGWTVALTILILQLVAEYIYKIITYQARKERLVELENMDEATLHSLFATKEEEEVIGKDINDLFKKFEESPGRSED